MGSAVFLPADRVLLALPRGPTGRESLTVHLDRIRQAIYDLREEQMTD